MAPSSTSPTPSTAPSRGPSPVRSTSRSRPPSGSPAPGWSPTPTPAPATRPGTIDPRFLLTRLQQEWDRLSISRRALLRAQGWHLGVGAFDTLDDLVRLIGGGRRTTAGVHDDDEVLARMVRLARTDELAGRVLLQRLLPGLAAMTRRRSWSFTRELDGFADVLTVAWTVIRSYDVDRRPVYVAANLLRDIEYHAYRKPYRRRWEVIVVDGSDFDRQVGDDDPAEDRDPAVVLAEVLRLAARAGVDESDLDFARRLAAGATTRELAAEWCVTDRTVRNRRTAMLARMRAAVIDEPAA